MDRLDVYRAQSRDSDRRVLYVVVDGLGGLPREPGGPTELEAATTPTMDELARRGECGLTTPVLPGLAPGSGPAHIALFGYDPVRHQVGRGVLAALGIGFDLRPGDVAARINFCTLDDQGNVADRRAGRIDDPEAEPLARRLDGIEVGDGVDCFVRHVKQYRACVVFRGPGVDGDVADTDPQRTGVPPREPEARSDDARKTAELAARFVHAAREELRDEADANGVLLRGFDTFRPLPDFASLYRVDAVGIATYPDYLGIARLAGMDAQAAESVDDLEARAAAADGHDFVFLHYKKTDSAGEDGDFDAKVAEIERADALLGAIHERFDVVMVTGDHSTPAVMRAHSFHPNPLLIHSELCRPGPVENFGERSCARGTLGHLRSVDVLPLTLAHAGRFKKFGA